MVPGHTTDITVLLLALRAAARSLALPIFGELTIEQQRHVVGSIADFYRGR